MAEQVRAEARRAWQGYMHFAKGHDDLKPLGSAPRDWYRHSLLMSPIDALDTLILLGLDKEADEARELIASRLSFDRDMHVHNFEITIRALKGRAQRACAARRKIRWRAPCSRKPSSKVLLPVVLAG